MTVNGLSNGHIGEGIAPKITLYTNHGCPFAHRAHIALEELKLPFEEVIIDLKTPRPQWYLDINPRGLVPSIKYSVEGIHDQQILTESAIVAQFLADSFPSHLLPATREDPYAALTRAKVNFFTDTWTSKLSPVQMAIVRGPPGEKPAKVDEFVRVLKKEIEPLLADAKPFFNGSSELTFAEVIVAPFVLRLYALADDGEVIPATLTEQLAQLPNFSKWVDAIKGRESVTKIFDSKAFVEGTKWRLGQSKPKA